MATNFPASLDSLTNPAAGDSLSSPSHSAQHANINDAMEAVQTKLGVGNHTIGEWTNYTPTFSSADGGAGLGNGTIAGRYCLVNKLVFVENTITFGSTSTFGTQRFLFSTPVALAAPLSSFCMVNGSGMAYDITSPVNAYVVTVGHNGSSTTSIMLRAEGTAFGEVDNNLPFTWASGDIINFGYVARAA